MKVGREVAGEWRFPWDSSRILRVAWFVLENSASREDGSEREANLYDSGDLGLRKVGSQVARELRSP